MNKNTGLFRAKTTLSSAELKERNINTYNGWIYGTVLGGFMIKGIVSADDKGMIIDQWSPIDINTIGQKALWTDSIDEPIFSGDIVLYRGDQKDIYGVVEFTGNEFVMHMENGRTWDAGYVKHIIDHISVIGNETDSPDWKENI